MKFVEEEIFFVQIKGEMLWLNVWVCVTEMGVYMKISKVDNVRAGVLLKGGVVKGDIY